MQFLVLAVCSAQAPSASIARLSSFSCSFVLVQLLPHLLYPLPLLFSRLAIRLCLLKSQPAQAHVDFVFRVGTIARHFPEEALVVAFF